MIFSLEYLRVGDTEVPFPARSDSFTGKHYVPPQIDPGKTILMRPICRSSTNYSLFPTGMITVLFLRQLRL